MADMMNDRPQGLNAPLTDEDKRNAAQQNAVEADRKVINRVIKGENDMFEKRYDFEEMDLHFDIKVKFPNMIEQAKIQAAAERYFDGLGGLMPLNAIMAYRMLATLRICGKTVPDFLAQDEDIYNAQILTVISEDFQEWMSTFQY